MVCPNFAEPTQDLEIQKLFFEDAIIEHFEKVLTQDALSLIPKGVSGVGQVSDVLKGILKHAPKILQLKAVLEEV